MKVSWNYFKISMAGAKLSHLVQKDKIWDHGSMTEQVKNIFYHVEKAKNKREPELATKYVTAKALAQIDALIKQYESGKPILKTAVLTQVSILDVNLRTGNKPDRFTAFIEGKREATEDRNPQKLEGINKDFGVETFSERWYFIRQGEWWMLHEMKA